ncbi:MAG: transposase [Thermoplasmatales archaeon]
MVCFTGQSPFYEVEKRCIPAANLSTDTPSTISCYLYGVLPYFKHHITNAIAEGMNSKIATVQKMAYGYRNRYHEDGHILSLWELAALSHYLQKSRIKS